MYQPGDVIEDRYRVFERKKGGMGFVFLCEDLAWLKNGKPTKIALKTLLPHLQSIPGASDRFYNEASLWVKMGKHTNVLHALYVKKINDFPFIFMEYIQGLPDRGPDLESWIRTKTMKMEHILHFAIQFCNGMIYAVEFFAQQGLHFLHRDIKPGNIMINQRGVAKITDFGLSKVAEGAIRESSSEGRIGIRHDDVNLTSADTIMGTPAYMSPEQCKGSADLDIRSDIYSFGCVFFKMLTSNTPFTPSKITDMLMKHITEEPPLPSSVIPEIPSNIDDIVHRCLQKNPDNRYPSFHALREDIARIFQQVVGMPHPSLASVDQKRNRADLDDKLNKSLSLYELGDTKEGLRLFAEVIGAKKIPQKTGSQPIAQRTTRRRLVKRQATIKKQGIPSGQTRLTGATPNSGSNAPTKILRKAKPADLENKSKRQPEQAADSEETVAYDKGRDKGKANSPNNRPED